MIRKDITNEYLETQIKSHKYQLIEDTILYCIIVDKNGYTFTGEAFCKVTDKIDNPLIKDLAFERALDSMRGPYTFLRTLESKLEKEEEEKTHRQRVIEDLAVLEDRLEKLSLFLSTDEIPIFLTEEHWNLLKEQREVMIKYKEIIDKRLELF